MKPVSGNGETLAIAIVLETGAIRRLAEAGHLSSWCCRVNSRSETNKEKKGEGSHKNGNRYLAWAFAGAANLARARYQVLKTQQPFVVKRCFAWLGLALGGGPGTRMAFEHHLS